MGKIIAMCGLLCDKCIAYIATQKNDEQLGQKAVDTWSTETGKLELSDIYCDGCLSGKRIYKFCLVCEVRKCGSEKKVKNCAYCMEYPCEKLERLWRGFRTVSWEEAKATLDSCRKTKQ